MVNLKMIKKTTPKHIDLSLFRKNSHVTNENFPTSNLIQK